MHYICLSTYINKVYILFHHSSLLFDIKFTLLMIQPNHTEMLAASPSNESVATSCHPEFTSVCSLCLPSCTDLYYNTRIGKGLQIDDAAKILASCFAVFGAVVFTILALLKWKDVYVKVKPITNASCIHYTVKSHCLEP